MVGVWTVRVTAANVPSGPQPYALVSLGALGSGWGIVYLDREMYGENDTIEINVRDTGPASVDVIIWSATEPMPEPVSLTESPPSSGRWIGYIDTNQGNVLPDGLLQVNDGDLVVVQYDDTSPPQVSTDTATIDASYPAIFGVSVANITSSTANVMWTTSEPADSRVYYNRTMPLDIEEYASEYRILHDVPLIGLTPETIYTFDVESSDPFGHTTRADNGGAHWQFTTLKLRPDPPTNVRAWLIGPTHQHVRIAWDPSADAATMVDNYAIYYSIGSYTPNGTGYQFLAQVPTGINFYDHWLYGHGNPWNVFYYVQANWSGGLPSTFTDQVAKFTRWAPAGPVLLSFPLKMVDSSIEWALKTVSWDKARYYDPWDADHWKEFHRGKYWDDFPAVNQSMAIWVNLTSAERVTSAGVVPANMTINLREGWNLVGFPHMFYDYTVGDLMAQTGAERVEGYNSITPPYFLQSLAGIDFMAPGEGYWIKVPVGRF
jgi:hypothetical protein